MAADTALHRTSVQRDDEETHRPEAITLLALSFALGITLGWYQPRPIVWPWLVGSAAFLVMVVVSRRWRWRWTLMFMAVATMSMGAAWVTVRQHFVAGNDLAGWMADEPVLVQVQGEAMAAPELRDRTTGSMGLFDYRSPATYFPMRVDALIGPDGEPTPVRTKLYVRVEQTIAPFRAGDRIDATGWFHKVAPPLNPGEFDFQRFARSLGQAGLLTVERRELLIVSPTTRPGLRTKLLNWRDTLRRRAGGWLLSNLPDTERTERDALLAALLLGQRGPDLTGLGESFRRVGLAHLLAISGFHLGVLAGFVLLLVRFTGRARRWHGWLVIATVMMYLILVEVRMPVLRAGVMTMAASLALVFGRRLRVRGLIALSGIVLLLWRPDQLFTPGFQLSFAVVLGLIHLQPILRRRWFGAPNQLAASASQMVGQWLRAAFAAAMAAWLIATPIQMYHFGAMSPLCVPLTIVALPLVSVLLAMGYVKMLLAILLPSASLLLGVLLSIGAEVLISIVQAIDTVPGAAVRVPYPAAVWSMLALVWVYWWVMRPRRRERRVQWVAAAALVIWLLWPMLPLGRGPALRIDMLAVGDGSCYLVRSGRSTVVFDAGSGDSLNAGQQRLVPAMRRLGVRRVDVIVISHPNLDHYSAVLEIVDAFDVGTALVTPQLLGRAEADPFGPVAYLLTGLTDRFVSVLAVGRGEARAFGRASWTWLHPQTSQAYERANNGSMVIRIEAAGRRVLLCGDIQRRATEALLQGGVDLGADVMELPHHGSHHERAETFVRTVDPRVVLQSTGWSRWRRDRWADVLTGATRLVTARDGACWVEIDDGGAISLGRFRNP